MVTGSQQLCIIFLLLEPGSCSCGTLEPQDVELRSFHIRLPMIFEISSDVGYKLTWKESHPSLSLQSLNKNRE